VTDLPPLATIPQLEVRLGLTPGTLADNDLARAEAAIADASDLVRTESRLDWTDLGGALPAPPAAVVVVLQIAKRAYNNPNNYASESVAADGASYTYSNDQRALEIYLTDDELRTIQAAARDATTALGSSKWRGTGSVRTPSPVVRGLPAGYDPWMWHP
jgi:hypothetical protein